MDSLQLRSVSASELLSQHQAYTAIHFQVPGHSVEKIARERDWWQDSHLFRSKIDFRRKATSVTAGNIGFAEFPLSVFSKGGAFSYVMFKFRGFVKPCPAENDTFIHVDTRGYRVAYGG